MAGRDESDCKDTNILVKLISSSIFSCAKYCYFNKNNKEYNIEKNIELQKSTLLLCILP